MISDEDRGKLFNLGLAFVEAIRDGKIDRDEAAELVRQIAELVPTERILDELYDLLDDALTRDPAKLFTRMENMEARAAEALAEGRARKAARLLRRAERKADKILRKFPDSPQAEAIRAREDD